MRPLVVNTDGKMPSCSARYHLLPGVYARVSYEEAHTTHVTTTDDSEEEEEEEPEETARIRWKECVRATGILRKTRSLVARYEYVRPADVLSEGTVDDYLAANHFTTIPTPYLFRHEKGYTPRKRGQQAAKHKTDPQTHSNDDSAVAIEHAHPALALAPVAAESGDDLRTTTAAPPPPSSGTTVDSAERGDAVGQYAAMIDEAVRRELGPTSATATERYTGVPDEQTAISAACDGISSIVQLLVLALPGQNKRQAWDVASRILRRLESAAQ